MIQRNKDVRSVLLPALVCAVAFVIAGPSRVAAAPYTLEGRCVGCVDGDTIDVLTSDKKTHRIRIAEIDSPERNQPYGKGAKQALSKLTFGKDVKVNVSKRERWGRELGTVTVGEFDVGGTQVRRGWAMVYRAYPYRVILLDYEAEAKAAQRGLWKSDKQIPPWNWRRGIR